MFYKFTSPIVLFIIIQLTSCNNGSTEIGNLNGLVDIVQTDSIGRIIIDDPKQWRGRFNLSNNTGQGGVVHRDPVTMGWGFGPAYSNPSSSDSMKIPFSTPLGINITIICYSRTEYVNIVVDTVFSGYCKAGIYYFNYRSKLPKGIYRVQLSTDKNYFSSYGNIQFK